MVSWTITDACSTAICLTSLVSLAWFTLVRWALKVRDVRSDDCAAPAEGWLFRWTCYPNSFRISSRRRRIRDHRMLCPGVRGRVVGVVSSKDGLVLGGRAVVALGVVWVALVIRTGEDLRGSRLGDRSSIAMSFHWGGVWLAAASCGGDSIRSGDGSREFPLVGRLGDGRGLVGRPRELRGLRGSASDGAYVNRALDESG